MIMTTSGNIFGGIANQTRREILSKLKTENKRISQISKELDVSMQSLEKHTKKLLDAGLIQKNSNELGLTEIGKGVFDQIISLEFLEKNKEFFSKYSLSYFPPEFVERIGELRNFEKVAGYVITVEKYKQFLDETREFAKIIVPQISLEIYKDGMQKLKKNNIDVFYILGENAIIPKGWLQLQKDLKEQDMVSHGKLHRRMLEKVYVMLYLSEKVAFLALPSMEGVADPTIMFTSRDKEFRKWCLDYFDFLWKQSKSFVESKVHEI